mmetsp:Transcript_2667/g.3633  ORF Transcript_2667/g.3633 Transcript_2667/m.3633 type:complete len:217 (+) Transcript_2667:2-652(+)
MIDVGFPAKSGVSGGIMGVVPGSCGIAIYSPRLDENYNSVRGMLVCAQLSELLGLHLMRKNVGQASRRKETSSRKGSNASRTGGNTYGGTKKGGSKRNGSAEGSIPQIRKVSFDHDGAFDSSPKTSTPYSSGVLLDMGSELLHNSKPSVPRISESSEYVVTQEVMNDHSVLAFTSERTEKTLERQLTRSGQLDSASRSSFEVFCVEAVKDSFSSGL